MHVEAATVKRLEVEDSFGGILEATTGLEPVNVGFANLCLTNLATAPSETIA